MADPIKLDASTEERLANAIEKLAPGQQGSITFKEAQWLFSGLDEADETALSEFDIDGLRNLGTFAAECNCSPKRQGDMVLFTKTGG